MGIYSTRQLNRDEAIKELLPVYKTPYQMTNEELEEALFQFLGREGLENSPLNNYIVTD